VNGADMHTASRQKWILFISLFGLHFFLSWQAIKFDWLLLIEVAMLPALILESMGIDLSSCYQFICMPNAAGWTICVLVWGAFHYWVATLLNKWVSGTVAK
jgi:hypothetical protein